MSGKQKEYIDCADCPYILDAPELMNENVESVRVWHLVQGQRIVAGMTGITIDINHLAVWEILDRYGIEDKITCFEKILVIASETFKHEADIREANQK